MVISIYLHMLWPGGKEFFDRTEIIIKNIMSELFLKKISSFNLWVMKPLG